MMLKRVIEFNTCYNFLGYSCRIICTFEGTLNRDGMVEDFSYLKQVMMKEIHDVADHSYIVWSGDTEEIDITNVCTMRFIKDATSDMHINLSFVGISSLDFLKASGKKVLVTDDPPTAETLAKYFGEKVRMAILDKPFYLHSLEWWETPNNCAVYFPGEDQIKFDDDPVLREQLDKKGY